MEQFINYWNAQLFGKFQSITIMIAFFIIGYLVSIFLYKIIAFILIKVSSTNHKTISQNFKLSLRIFLIVVFLNIGLAFTDFYDKTYFIVNKILFVLTVFSFAYILIRIFQFIKDVLYLKFNVNIIGNINERRARTQVDFLQKTGTAFIIIIAIAIVLMSFDRVRELGTSLLASAGIAGVIIGFAAQKSLANLLAGFQIAFTQPIRYDDVVIVQSQYGRIEEITLTYVVVRLWDERRLILPISYFIDNPFENWTRNSAEMLGTVMLYADYTIPLDPLRAELKRILSNEGKLIWDGRVGIVQLTDVKEQVVEIRVLVSAASSGVLFDLRCLVRENMLKYIVQQYPNSLPSKRIISEQLIHPASGIVHT